MALNGADVDDFTWEPPTEAETKVLQARRERQDRISRLMGDYLLRGYRMLGDTCADCGVRRSSCKINSGKSTVWLVRSSTQTWIKITRH
uniref:Zinc ribbon domain containing 2 n=1 Tax=Mus musculus TaxID=10090 RepID=E0CYU9_MOUSE